MAISSPLPRKVSFAPVTFVPYIRAAFLTAALAPCVILVEIAHTAFSPYLDFTYSMAFGLMKFAKSQSISGILTRSGFRNLSNKRLNLIGSTSVIPVK